MVSDVETGLLSGLRILDLTRVLAGPYATSLLADMGAEVIKIESPTSPDGLRTTPPFVNGFSNHFININRNKSSLALEVGSDRGREIFFSLVRTADVVVENFRPGMMDRLGISYETLAEVNERIIVCSISGFGQTGSYRGKPAYDVIIQAMSGVMSVTGEPGGNPVRMGIPMGDLAGGIYGAIGILAALHDRSTTGKGQHVDVSMLDGLTHLTTYYPIDYLNKGDIAGPVGGRHPHIAPYGLFPVKDGHLVCAIFTAKFWERFCTGIERPELFSDPRFAKAPDRLKNKDELYEVLDAVMLTRTQAEWNEVFEEAGIPFAPLLRFDQVATLPVLHEREMFVEMEHPTAGKVSVSGRPIKFPQRGAFRATPAPELGRDTDQVLSALLDLSGDDVAQLRADGVVK